MTNTHFLGEIKCLAWHYHQRNAKIVGLMIFPGLPMHNWTNHYHIFLNYKKGGKYLMSSIIWIIWNRNLVKNVTEQKGVEWNELKTGEIKKMRVFQTLYPKKSKIRRLGEVKWRITLICFLTERIKERFLIYFGLIICYTIFSV